MKVIITGAGEWLDKLRIAVEVIEDIEQVHENLTQPKQACFAGFSAQVFILWREARRTE